MQCFERDFFDEALVSAKPETGHVGEALMSSANSIGMQLTLRCMIFLAYMPCFNSLLHVGKHASVPLKSSSTC